MKKIFTTLVVVLLASITTQAQRFEMIWSEEFDGSELNRDLWTPWIGTAYNNELQYYSDRSVNLFVEEGLLHLRARKESYRGRQYTSARIKSQGNFHFKYGKIEARMKLPAGKGFWPAFWLMPEYSVYGGWPRSGEVDIMEFRGQEPHTTTQAIHFSYQNNHHYQANSVRFSDKDFTEGFHIFRLDWDDNGFTWYVDDIQLHQLTKEQMYANPFPFDESFYVILNLAVGGDFLDNPDASTPFPSDVEVDYVRVYQDVNQLPDVELSIQNIEAEPGEEITIPFTTQDEDGTVERIDLYIGSDSVDTFSAEIDEITLNSIMIGCHDVTLHAIDNDNGVSVSGSVSITVGDGCDRVPFNNEPSDISDGINLADFDKGGNGVGYFDQTPNSNNDHSYRPFDAVELVEVEENELTDVPAGVHFNDSEEWTSYTISIPTTGTYGLELLYKSLAPTNYPRLVLKLGDERFYRFLWISHNNGEIGSLTRNVELPEGEHVLYLVSEVDPIVVYELNTTLVTAIEDYDGIPTEIAVSEAYPNPFNPQTTLQLNLDTNMPVKADVYSVTGLHVETIVHSQLSAGEHTLTWNAKDVASGVYVISIQAGEQRIMRKVTLLK